MVTMQNGVNKVSIIYAAGASMDNKSIVYGTVEKQDHLPLTITSRMGDSISVSDDALDSLIIALQMVQKEIQIGIIKKGI